MEWLKKLLEGAKITDGKLDVEALMASINTEFPKQAVPKDKFNDVSTRLKTAEKTIDDLKKDNSDNETLQKTIKEHEATISTLKADAERKEKESIVKAAFIEAGATDADYMIFKHGGIDKFERDKDGKVKDIENIVKSSKESNPTYYAVKKDDKKPNLIPNQLPGGAPAGAEGDDIAATFANALNGVF